MSISFAKDLLYTPAARSFSMVSATNLVRAWYLGLAPSPRLGFSDIAVLQKQPAVAPLPGCLSFGLALGKYAAVAPPGRLLTVA